MKTSIYGIFLLFIALTIQGQERNFKRGLAYGHHSADDLRAISNGISWWYNWWHQPETPVRAIYRDLGVEFVPQAWNGRFNRAAMRAYYQSNPDANYILGFNEPNFLEQANMLPREAAAAWPDVESIANEFGLTIVSPAVNFSWVGGAPWEVINGDTIHYNDPWVWLDAFFAACVGCRVDHIAIHSYMNHVGALEWFINEFYRRYNKPIWLKEFCAWEGEVSLEMQRNFMRQALVMLDNNPQIYRYAWFSGRSTGNPHFGLFAGSGELTELGRMYAGLAENLDNALTLRVIDRTRGLVTNNTIWPDQAVYTWLGNTSNWASISNSGAWWAGMYNGLPGGRLEKTDEAWIWSYTFEPEFGMSYHWNPGIFVDTARTENSLMAMHVNRNLAFSVSTTGIVNGEVTLVIENATTATVTPETFSLGPTSVETLPVDYSETVTVFPNPAGDIINVSTPTEIASITIYDMRGSKVYQNWQQNYANVSGLNPGNYIMQVVMIDNGFAMEMISVAR